MKIGIILMAFLTGSVVGVYYSNPVQEALLWQDKARLVQLMLTRD